MNRVLRAIDICGGGGGWAIAARGLPIKIVTAMDWAEDCCATYRYNHPETEVRCVNVKEVDFREFRRIDLVLGGVPCETISVARNSMPADEQELTEWKELLERILRAVRLIRPYRWCLENVMGMREHLPLDVPYKLLNSVNWSAQNRKRIFVGRFPDPLPNGKTAHSLQDHLLPGPYIVSSRILAAKNISNRQWYQPETKRLLNPSKPSPTVTDFSRHSRGFVVRVLSPQSAAPTIVASARCDGSPYVIPNGERERVLQFTEAAALQGFPSDYVFVSSQSRAWKMVAQAIQINLGRAILKAICAEAGLLKIPEKGDVDA
jgi:site-specific DNA-cytosine methylase